MSVQILENPSTQNWLNIYAKNITANSVSVADQYIDNLDVGESITLGSTVDVPNMGVKITTNGVASPATPLLIVDPGQASEIPSYISNSVLTGLQPTLNSYEVIPSISNSVGSVTAITYNIARCVRIGNIWWISHILRATITTGASNVLSYNVNLNLPSIPPAVAQSQPFAVSSSNSVAYVDTTAVEWSDLTGLNVLVTYSVPIVATPADISVVGTLSLIFP